jgi:GNAT superfamily N-acetyltransferase
MKLVVRSVTPDLWPALEELFGPSGACNGCWCMYWRIGADYHRRDRSLNREALRRLVRRGPPPGLLAFDDAVAVGWCQLTPRAELPWLDRFRALAPIDELPVWSLSCFFVRRSHRGRGVVAALLAAAVAAAKEAGAPALEAYPIDPDAPGATKNDFTGTTPAFERAGFVVAARRIPHRPILRHDLS